MGTQRNPRSLAAFALILETHQNNCSNVTILCFCCPSPGLGPKFSRARRALHACVAPTWTTTTGTTRC